MADEEGTRQQQLQRALQLALRLEDALSTCKANVVRRHARTAVSKDLSLPRWIRTPIRHEGNTVY